jgi:hypothetical protein
MTNSCDQDDLAANGFVGRFRSCRQIGELHVALNEWRVTTGDAGVAAVIYDVLGGDTPAEWDAEGENNLEVLTAAKSVAVILDGPTALRHKQVLWSRNGKPILSGDWPALKHQDHRGASAASVGEPQTAITFRLGAEPSLGTFELQTGSWSLASDLAYKGVEDSLWEIGGPANAILALEEVSFTAKNGSTRGSIIQYSKPVLTIDGPVARLPTYP